MPKSFPLLALLLTACLDSGSNTNTLDDDCGLPPNGPVTAVTLMGDTATMSRSHYEAIEAWRHDVGLWFMCAESRK